MDPYLIDRNALREVLLFYYYKRYLDDSPFKYIHPKDLGESLPTIPPRIGQDAAYALHQDTSLLVTGSSASGYALSAKGIRYVEAEARREGSIIRSLWLDGEAIIPRLVRVPLIDDEGSARADEVPAADRFVSLDHNSVVYQEATETLDRLANAVRDSNELSVTPDERLAVIREVQGLRTYLENTSIRVAPIRNAISESGILGWLTKEAASGVIGALVGAAVLALVALITTGS